jgi:hypothetical protein
MDKNNDDFFGDMFGDGFDDDFIRNFGGFSSFLKGFREHHFNNKEELGEPDSVREFKQDGHTFVEKIWNTPTGKVKIIESTNINIENDDFDIESVTDYDSLGINMNDIEDFFSFVSGISSPRKNKHFPNREITKEEKIDLLNTKLQYCLDTEDYERAARLRDMIAELKEEKSEN